MKGYVLKSSVALLLTYKKKIETVTRSTYLPVFLVRLIYHGEKNQGIIQSYYVIIYCYLFI